MSPSYALTVPVPWSINLPPFHSFCYSSYYDVKPNGSYNPYGQYTDRVYELVLYPIVIRFIEDLRFVSFCGNKTAIIWHEQKIENPIGVFQTESAIAYALYFGKQCVDLEVIVRCTGKLIYRNAPIRTNSHKALAAINKDQQRMIRLSSAKRISG